MQVLLGVEVARGLQTFVQSDAEPVLPGLLWGLDARVDHLRVGVDVEGGAEHGGRGQVNRLSCVVQ